MSGNRVSNNFNNNQFQQQQQFKQSLQQQQAEIRYYVYQDLQNLINLIYARNAVLEHFKNEPSHPMITLSNNKILLQLNLSCSIHLDQTQSYKNDPNLLKFLKDERIKAFNILKKVIGSNEQLKNNSAIYLNNRKLENELQRYKQFYETQKFELNQFQTQETGLQAKFDESVLAKIISSVQSVDSKIDQLRNGQSYDSPSEYDILKTALNYQKVAEIQLKSNFSKNNINTNERKLVCTNSNHQQSNGDMDQQNDQLNASDEDQEEQLLEFLIFSGFFNQERIDNSLKNEIQKKIDELNKQYGEDLTRLKYLASDQNLFYNLYLLHYFFQIYHEYQQNKSTNKEQKKSTKLRAIFNQSLNFTENQNPYFLKFLQFIYPNTNMEYYDQQNLEEYAYKLYLKFKDNLQSQIINMI